MAVVVDDHHRPADDARAAGRAVPVEDGTGDAVDEIWIAARAAAGGERAGAGIYRHPVPRRGFCISGWKNGLLKCDTPCHRCHRGVTENGVFVTPL